ncbi:class I SAM-dependent methyltransferase [Akkermansiaceae bacterium]|nr:class I SAM-dependent methyltransferase [Akkermansiaceae bacterium]
MSLFENYTNTSANYDLTRQPVGLELIFGALACGSRPLGDQTVLDAGCGTGNYLPALAGKVARVEGVELNPGMLETARTKMANHQEVTLQQGSVLELPIESGSCDGVVVNYVLHHLEDGSDESFAATRSSVAEFSRVLAPGRDFGDPNLLPRAVPSGLLVFCTHPRSDRPTGQAVHSPRPSRAGHERVRPGTGWPTGFP